MKTNSKTSLIFLLNLFIIPFSLFAQPNQPLYPIERVSNTNQLYPIERVSNTNQLYPIERVSNTNQLYPIERVTYNDQSKPFFLKVQNYYYPPNTRFIQSLQVDGRSIILDDGSEWKVQGRHAYEIRQSWWKDDPIVVTPANWPFFSSRFYITNLRTGSWVYSDIEIGPNNGPYTNEIVEMDYYCGRVILIDGRGVETCWEVDPQEMALLQDWMMYQAVFIGSASNPLREDSSYYDCILLNIERNRVVKAHRI